MEIRKIIQEEVEKFLEANIEEAAMRIGNLPETTALFVSPNNAGFELNLYDPKSKNAYGTITFIKNKLSPHYYVSGVAAEKGFGPFMYELAMMQAKQAGNYLMPSRDGDVREAAFNVWRKFYDRSDVDKKEYNLYDDEFKFDLLTGSDEVYSNEEKKETWGEISDEEKKDLKVFNTAYAMNPDSSYGELVRRSDGYSDKVKDRAENAGAKLWDGSYLSEGEIKDEKLKEIIPGTFRYDGNVDTYHLSTTQDLEVGKTMESQNSELNKTERGGSGDYVYSSNDPKGWVDIFKSEGGNVPKYLYKVTVNNPKYRKPFKNFGKTTPGQFMSSPEDVTITKYLGEI